MRYDAVVRGGTAIVAGSGLLECDLAVRDGAIAAILDRGTQCEADEAIDATGLIVFPGVIDAHVHFGLGSPDDWGTESGAAVLGGVTAVLNYIQSADSYLDAEPRERERAESESVVDYAFHFILMNDRHLDEIPVYIDELDVSSFKFFTNFKGDEGAYMGIEGTDAGFFYALCRAIAERPEAVLAVHTENIEVVWRLAAELKAAGRDDLAAWTESRPDFVEAHDMFTAFLFAERTGCRVYIPHLSSAAGLRTYLEHAARGGRSYLETCPHYLTHTKDVDLGSRLKVNPPVRTNLDREALWGAVSDGTIAVVGSDHNSRKLERKQGSIWSASAGFPGVTTLLPVLLSEGYHKRGIPLPTIASAVSANPARIFGLHPAKGTLAVGTDADFTLVDLEKEAEVDSSMFGSHADYSIYDGWKLRGWPVTTVIRGEIVMEKGEVVASPGYGRRVVRNDAKATAVARSTSGA